MAWHTNVFKPQNVYMSGADWSRSEVEAIVDDYLSMLASELSGTPYNKSAHRKSLRPFLSDRSDQSVEFKHSNISAALLDAGFPYIEWVQASVELPVQLFRLDVPCMQRSQADQ